MVLHLTGILTGIVLLKNERGALPLAAPRQRLGAHAGQLLRPPGAPRHAAAGVPGARAPLPDPWFGAPRASSCNGRMLIHAAGMERLLMLTRWGEL